MRLNDNDILRTAGVDPETTKLYRHTGDRAQAELAKGEIP